MTGKNFKKLKTMKTLLIYRAYNEQGVQIDKIRISGSISRARNIFRETWSGYLKITCDETNEQRISRK